MTRSLLLAALALITCAACDEKKELPPSPSTAPEPSALAPFLGLDAGLFGDPVDPPPPAGDLKTELERFVNLDTCVKERANLDPLVGDALGAIGYDTFLRDACRMLEAAKDKRRESCAKIDASALRSRCEAWVAMIAQTPETCPLQFEGVVTRGRQSTCVAVAAKDPRLCAGEGRSTARITCAALVTREPARCDVLSPLERPACQREVARWRSLLPAPLEGLKDLGAPRAKLTVHGTNGTADPPTTESDVSGDFARGIVVVTTGDESTSTRRLRAELGTIVESEAARFAASPQKNPRLGLAVILTETRSKAEPLTTVQKLELELPAEAPLVSPPASCDCKLTTVKIPRVRGDEAHLVLDGTLTQNGRSYKIGLDVTTFVRDAVPEGREIGEGRVLPPVHPTIRPR